MLKFNLLLLSFLICSVSYSQVTIQGQTLDSKTQKPIPSVIIYLDGTSYHTTTDENGYFTLTIPEQIKTNMVLSHIAYRITVFPDPFTIKNTKLLMVPKEVAIDKVVVEGSNKVKRAYSEDKRMDAFKAMFLGTTDAGRSCEIENEEDINLVYDASENELHAFANKPIIFKNKYLGYTVHFLLLEFKAKYHSNANDLNELSSGESYFNGITMFVDDAPNDKKINRHRNEVYQKTPTYLFRCLINGVLYENSAFRLYANNKLIYPEEFFHVIDTMGSKLVIVVPEEIERQRSRRLPQGVRASLSVTIGAGITTNTNANRYGDGQGYDPMNPRRATNLDTLQGADQSSVDMKSFSIIYFYNPSFFVDYYGNVEDPNALRYSGTLSQIRAGDMLPDDFRPKVTSNMNSKK